MGKTLTVQMAKPSVRDFEAVYRLRDILESLCEYRQLPPSPADDPDAPPVEVPADELAETIGDRVERWWANHSPSFFRVVFGGQVAVQTFCDPTADVIAWRPEVVALATALENLANEQHPCDDDASSTWCCTHQHSRCQTDKLVADARAALAGIKK